LAKIFYSLSGEGRGHAMRVRAVVENLRGDHDFTLYAYGDALDLLRPLCRSGRVLLKEIPGPRLHYRGFRLDPLRTTALGLKYLFRDLPGLVDRLGEEIRRGRPDLVITDFEPALPRAALRCGVPFVSLNHQHMLLVNDFSSFPARLRWYGDAMGALVRAYYRGQEKTIVSSFFATPLKPSFRGHALPVGVLLRPELLNATPWRGGYLAAYLRRSATPSLLSALARCGLPVHLYGLGLRPDLGGIRFRAVDNRAFVEDLAGAEALVCTAGNQLVGEALYLEKPVLALPETGNREQEINGHLLRVSGWGRSMAADKLTPGGLRAFLDGLGRLRDDLRPEAVNGTAATLSALRPYLA